MRAPSKTPPARGLTASVFLSLPNKAFSIQAMVSLRDSAVLVHLKPLISSPSSSCC
jgi:hypothetical protein